MRDHTQDEFSPPGDRQVTSLWQRPVAAYADQVGRYNLIGALLSLY